jgi:phage gp29-like protein
VIPDDSSVEIKESAGKAASADIYERLLLFSDAQVSKALLGQTLTTEIGKTGGAYAASETHMQVRQEIVDGDTDLVIATYNALIRWVVDLNFGTGVPAPGFKMWREKQVSKDQADRDKLLSDTGQVEFTEQYFKREYNFQDGDIIVRPKPEPTPPPAAPAPAAAAPLEPDASEFSEPGGPGRDPAPDQTALDLAMSLAVQPKDLQAAAEPMLRPFIDLVRQGASIEAVMERLVETYPAMNLDELVKILERVLFVAGIWGRLHAGR